MKKVNQKPTSNTTNNSKTNPEHGMDIPKKKSVILLFLICTFTLTIYHGFWYIKRVKELNNLKTTTKIKKTIPIILVILTFTELIIIGSLFGIAGFDDSVAYEDIIKYSDIPTSFIVLDITLLTLLLIHAILIILISFKTRKILNESLTNKKIQRKTSGFFTLFFNFLYLQYEINRIIKDKETESRMGPWIAFILFYIIPIIAGITSFALQYYA